MRLRYVDSLPRRISPTPPPSAWFPILDAFAESGARYAEVQGHGYNDVWEALGAGRAALASREVISHYMGRFRFEVRADALYIVRR